MDKSKTIFWKPTDVKKVENIVLVVTEEEEEDGSLLFYRVRRVKMDKSDGQNPKSYFGSIFPTYVKMVQNCHI